MIKVGIIGANFGATTHLPAFQSMPNVQVVALAHRETKAWSSLPEGVELFTHWQGMLEKKDLDVVSIATPPASHQEIVCAALKKHTAVLCEKPFGLNLEQSIMMENTRQLSGNLGAIGFQFRFDPGLQLLKQCYENGDIGSLTRMDIEWVTSGRSDVHRSWSWQHDITEGGGVLNSFVSHLIDLIFWLTGYNIISNQGYHSIRIPERKTIDENCKKVTAEDSVDFLSELEDGIMANIHVTNCQIPRQGLSIKFWGDRGLLKLECNGDKDHVSELHLLTGNNKKIMSLPTLATEDIDPRIFTYKRLVKCFIDAFEGNSSRDLPTFQDGVRMQKNLTLIKKSLCSLNAKTRLTDD